MKLLILLRHGKSDWHRDTGSDHDRPLAPRGIRAAKRMGTFLKAAGIQPARVWSSTAVRARTTAGLAIEAGEWSCPLELTDDLYATHVEGVLDLLRGLEHTPDPLMLVGHQPTWSDLASTLIGGGHLAVVTAAVVGIELGIERWHDVAPGVGSLRFLVPPRMLDD